MNRSLHQRLGLLVAACLAATGGASAQAQVLGTDFAAAYTVTDLGSVAGLPALYGGLTFADNNTLLIGGNANTEPGRIYSVGVSRDSANRITGFSGTASLYRGPASMIGEYNDGGVVFGPGGVLFTSRWPVNQLGQTKPGSIDEDKIVDMAALGIAESHAALNFVPAGFGGAGKLKLVSWGGGEWYSGTLTPDGMGTYNLVGLTHIDLDPGTPAIDGLPGGPEGFTYVSGLNPRFGVDSMLLSEFSAGTVAVYSMDANGDPILSSRRSFLDGLEGAEGAALDPLTGDFLFSTYGGGDRLVLVSGFTQPPPPPIPEPTTWTLMLAGLAGSMLLSQRRRFASRG
jgi:hypothetical protein